MPEQQELDRVVPLVEALSGLGVPLSGGYGEAGGDAGSPFGQAPI